MRRALAGLFRALSRLVDPAPREIVFDRPELDGQAIHHALSKYKRDRGLSTLDL